jgi:hypothetical protein
MKKESRELTRQHPAERTQKRPGPESAGQSGDTQGLSDVAEADSESVTELLEEGQYFEAEAVRGVENVPDADVSEVHTHQVSEDDVPMEYLEREDKP